MQAPTEPEGDDCWACLFDLIFSENCPEIDGPWNIALIEQVSLGIKNVRLLERKLFLLMLVKVPSYGIC